MIVMALVVVGTASYFRLGVDRFPSVELPTVSVRTELPGASVEEMETQVTQKIEEVVNTVQGISELRSLTGPGTSNVTVTFQLSRQVDVAAQDVREKVALALRNLPRDIRPPLISKLDNDAAPVLTLAVSGNRSLRELTEIADKTVKVDLERALGVGEVRVIGGLLRAVNIWVEADRLAAYQIPITAIRDAIVRQNADLPGGNVTAGRQEQSLRTMGRVVDPRSFNDLVVTTINGAPVRVRDIGRAEDGTKEQRSAVRVNGVPTVILEIRRQSGENTVAVIAAVKTNLARLTPFLPADVKVDVIRDQSRYIHAALGEINLHLVLGSILASLVVFAFMRSWRSTIIAAVAIPASVISAFGAMWALGFTLNSVTMLALVLMVGIVIDDAIVVLENIFRFVEEKRMSPFDAAREATADIGLAVMATTFSLVVIFVPVSFMSSVSGRFLYQFGLTAAVSVLVSLLVSFTLTPMMSARMLRAEDAAGEHDHARSRRGFYRLIDAGYAWLLRLAIHPVGRVVVVLVTIAVIASSVPLFGMVKREYVPTDVDEAEFEMFYEGPEGMSLAAMDEAVQAMDREIRAVRGIRLVLLSAGGNFLGRVNQGGGYVRIAPHEERTVTATRLWEGLRRGEPLAAFRDNYTQREVMAEVRQRLRKFRDMRITVRNIAGFNIGGGNFDIDYVLRGPDLSTLARYGEQLRQRAQQIGGMLDLNTTLRLDRPELRVKIDRERAADLRVDIEQIATALRLMVGGDQEVSRFRDPLLDQDYDVQLRLSEADRRDPRTIERLFVSRASAMASTAMGADPQVGMAPGGRAGPARQRRQDRARPDGLADRPLGAPAREPAAGGRRPRLRPGGPHRRPPPGDRGDESARRLHDRRVGPGARVRADLRRVPVGLPARRHLHVHDPGVPVREPGPPAHHPALAAAGGALRPLLAVVHREHPQPLLRPRHPRPVRRRQEERDPPDRPHERAAAGGAGPPDRDPARQPQPAPPDPDDDARPGRRHAAALAGDRPRGGGAAGHRGGGDRRADALAAADAADHAGGLPAVRGHRPGARPPEILARQPAGRPAGARLPRAERRPQRADPAGRGRPRRAGRAARGRVALSPAAGR